ncbi:TPA: class C sortase [Streptococcus suis]|uniref:class C sortase n=1 Tax=Streptococcus suis TaxID=1307 RepID=UPI00041428C5|nr:class C sortase [Streptococcus suis]NQR46436.1 class C sortase [Streptococcus suis]VTT13167.1 sortase-like protein [Streptococcus suis]HEM3201788.1 class C sortase [Streptococcus suis]HEM4242135.1 class C sortase [Streptococcus suis]HEM5037138.1 class C sortase [Streptococcus suis]
MKKLINHLTTFIILAGIIIVSYPAISQMYYNYVNQQTINDFDSGRKQLTSEEIDKRIQLAQAYNASLQNFAITDPYTEDQLEQGRTEYARMLTVREKIASIHIPDIEINLPIYAGSGEDVLQKGVGHLEGTSLPIGGVNSHAVLTTHTGLPNSRLFTDLDKLKVGDKFYITNIKETLAYQIDSITIIEPTDFSSLVVFPDQDYVTLLTCTPYMINSHRLLVRGQRIPYTPEDSEFIKTQSTNYQIPVLYLVVASLVVIIVLLAFFIKRQSKSKMK